MKKILLSCACCLLAIGLLAGCDTEEEDTTPDEPDATVPSTGGDDGSGDDEGSGPLTYKLGALDDTNNLYRWFNGEASGNFLAVTNDYNEGVEVTFEEVTSSEEGVTAVSISFVDTEGATKYISWSSSTSVDIADEPYAWYWVEENSVFAAESSFTAGSSTGRGLFLYADNPSFRAYSQTDQYLAYPHVRVYTSEPEAPEKPEPVGTMEVVETGVLGLYQENLGNYYYFTGEVNTSNFGVLSTSYADAVTVTEWKDEAYYYLTIGEGSSLKYIACPDTARSAMSLTSDPYCLLIDEETGAFLTGNGVEFLGTYSDYKTMSWSNAKSYLGNSGQFVAELYTSEQKLDVPTSITISGANEVYIDYSITLTLTFEGDSDRLDRGVTWSWTSSDSTGAITLEDGVVTGVTAGEVVVTATSTANPSVSDSITITVSEVPDGLPFDVNEEYWLGYTYNSSIYYFDGTIKSTYYGDVKTTSTSAVFITVGEVEGGYTLSFTDATGVTQYIYLYGDGQNHYDFGIQTTEYVFTFDYTLGTFVGPDGYGNLCYIGNYYDSSNTYDELRAMAVSDYGSNASRTYCIATLITPAEPASITISGKTEVVTEGSITLSASVPEGADYRVTWSISEGGTYASIDSATGVLTASSTANQTVKVIATSVKYTSVVSEAYEISIVAESSDVLLCTYNFANAGVDSATSTSFSSSDAVINYFAGTNIFEAGDCTSSPLTSASNISNAYHGAGGTENGQNSGLQMSGNCLKLGKSSNAGTLTLTFSGVTITGVELVATSWSTTNQTLTINSVSQTFTQAGTVDTVDEVNSYTYELSDCSELAMSSTERVLIFSMALYGTVTA